MSKAEKFIEDYTRNCSNEIIGGGWNNGEFVPFSGQGYVVGGN